MRFSLIRLPDSLPLGAFKALSCSALHGLSHQARLNSTLSWLTSIVCAEVVVICLWVRLAPKGHALSLTSPLDSTEAEALPSHRVVLSRWSAVLWPPPTSHPASPWISLSGLYQPPRWMCATDRVRPPLFHRLLSQHPALPTPEGSSRLLSRFCTASVAFVAHDQLGSLLLPLRG